MSLERERSLSIEVAQVPILVLASHAGLSLLPVDCCPCSEDFPAGSLLLVNASSPSPLV